MPSSSRDGAEVPDRFDARVRKAADLYNFALAAAYTSEDQVEVLLAGGVRRVPWGEVDVTFVERVVFISTPHRGSYVTLNTVVGWVTRLITLPFTVLGAVADIARLNPELAPRLAVARVPRACNGIWHRFLRTLVAIPVAPRHRRQLIIAGARQDREGRRRVAYTSAHIDGVESELVAGHPCRTSRRDEEVRRIPLLHSTPSRYPLTRDTALFRRRRGAATVARPATLPGATPRRSGRARAPAR
jgi:hypothetical protein